MELQYSQIRLTEIERWRVPETWYGDGQHSCHCHNSSCVSL